MSCCFYGDTLGSVSHDHERLTWDGFSEVSTSTVSRGIDDNLIAQKDMIAQSGSRRQQSLGMELLFSPKHPEVE